MTGYHLTATTFLPLVGAVLILLVGSERLARWSALAATVATLAVSVPLIQQIRVGAYILRQRIQGNKKYPLVLMLEPLFRCNLACAGCGKIDCPDDILNMRLSVEKCLKAGDECGAPSVSIPGGEPLIHKEIDEIVAGIVARKKFVYLCTNALLLEKKLHLFTPSP